MKGRLVKAVFAALHNAVYGVFIYFCLTYYNLLR